MALKYTSIFTLYFTRPSKIYPNWDFLLENIHTIWQPEQQMYVLNSHWKIEKNIDPIVLDAILGLFEDLYWTNIEASSLNKISIIISLSL
jgi:hypothetical protein